MNFKNKLKILSISSLSLVFLSLNAFSADLKEGINLYKIGEYDKSIKVLKELVKENPDNPEPHLWLSKCYEAKFNLDESIKEGRLYQKLKYETRNNKPKEVKKDSNKVDENNNEIVEENKPTQITSKNSDKLTYLDVVYLNSVIAKRDQAKQQRNFKYLDFKIIKDIFDQIPHDSEKLEKLYKEMLIKSHYKVASHEEEILLEKARAASIELEISSKKFELSQETNNNKKRSLEVEIKRLKDDYNDAVKSLTKLINKPVLPNTNPISYEHYKYLDTTPESHISFLEEKKVRLKEASVKTNEIIKNFKATIIRQEKELKQKAENINPEALNSKLEELSGSEKQQVQDYRHLEDKINNDKNRLLSYLKEQEVIVNSFNTINNTILKIQPSYELKDEPLPEVEKLQTEVINPENN